MSVRRIALGSLVIFSIMIVACLILSSIAQSSKRITGTYTSMHFNEEGGDVLGEELKIVVGKQGYQGALQFANGEPEDLLVVDIIVDQKKISFRVPDASEEAGYFTGTIEDGMIKGVFAYKGGATETVILKKGKSYWD